MFGMTVLYTELTRQKADGQARPTQLQFVLLVQAIDEASQVMDKS